MSGLCVVPLEVPFEVFSTGGMVMKKKNISAKRKKMESKRSREQLDFD